MAIIPGIPGLKVEIVSNDQICTEHADVYDDDTPSSSIAKIATNYLQIEPNSLFHVHTHIGATYPYHDYDLTVIIAIDGSGSSRSFLRKRSRLFPLQKLYVMLRQMLV